MNWSTTGIVLRLRLVGTISTALGLVAVTVAVGALYPAVGHTIGKLNLPPGVANLLGGADYGTLAGWFQSEIAVIYAPLVVSALAITGAAAAVAGEEETGILAVLLAHPIRPSRLLIAKGSAVGVIVAVTACAVWVGLVAGVAAAGGGIGIGHITALAVQLGFLGFATAALALTLAAATGRRSFASAVAAAIALLGWLVNSFAPLVGAISWLRYLTLFYYYEGHEPLLHGLDAPGLVVLGLVAVTLTALSTVAFDRRDLRA